MPDPNLLERYPPSRLLDILETALRDDSENALPSLIKENGEWHLIDRVYRQAIMRNLIDLATFVSKRSGDRWSSFTTPDLIAAFVAPDARLDYKQPKKRSPRKSKPLMPA